MKESKQERGTERNGYRKEEEHKEIETGRRRNRKELKQEEGTEESYN